MHMPPEQPAIDAARLELSQLRRQSLLARLELDRLQAELSALKDQAPLGLATDLQTANERLVLSTLRAQAQVVTYQLALDDANRQAKRDPLTGLPNRELLFERLNLAITTAHAQQHRIAVLFLDLNEFKQVNDLLGHATGDRFLRLTAERIGEIVDANVTVARYGGDEFVAVLTGLSSDAYAAATATALIEAFERPAIAGEDTLRLGVSIGISLYPEHADSAEALLAHADDAMYCAKRLSTTRFEFYDPRLVADLHAHRNALGANARALGARAASDADASEQHAQLRQANERLVLAALSAQELHAGAEKAYQRQSEFLAFVAHELRNPLTPIRAAGSMLATLPPDDLLRMQRIIEHEVVHMTRLIGDLLDLSRLHTGKLRLVLQAMDLCEIVQGAVDACRPAIDARLQTLALTIPEHALMMQGDRVRLSQVVRNLLDNASKYTSEHGHLALDLRQVADQALLVVSDTGIGISAQALPLVFEPFVQDMHAVGFDSAGMGIGLTVVREIVTAHGGLVVASSAGVDGGSTFRVSLPL
ncbi:diguanylate cyclase domain-containing protein [Xanthomonas translucens]|uniref:diguanylate cyclase domain-containing protein n=2 Tax=Xanthomonas campestris pv. translucens TaxID=343 RepID=UPI0003491719|nr:diguanylate cyclase [Xanthomonas translucens]AVY65318.1 alkaline phosphatase [Xanthomonas translucens pv. undulosa]MCT8283677.1 diguanylate cyclase [Xanthomonas translucens pv. undulosa]MCT8318448.1 diguanylate cyclase [Xanthomonas translucens pv. undulosa]WLA16506.1 diguanylate cyclase [Xanthomonas translucens]